MATDDRGAGTVPSASARHGDVPGKLMLAGEYAVVDGGRAVAAAVGSLVRWSLNEDPDRRGEVTLHAFNSTVRWRDGDAAPAGLAGFVAAGLRAAALAGMSLPGALELTVRTAAGGQKLGLGSSAAVVVATLRALAEGADRGFDASLLRLADEAHREAQGGKGSGYDVYAIGGGGLGLYDRAARSWQPLAWPAGVFGVALYSGAGADTREALDGKVRPTTDELGAIAAACDGLAEALCQGTPKAVLAALAGCEAAFAAMAARQPWLSTPALRAIAALAASHGGVARTSGAGGGDSMVCVFDDPAARDAAQLAWIRQGGTAVARLGEDLHSMGATPAHAAAGLEGRR